MAERFFRERGLTPEMVNVAGDRAAQRRMLALVKTKSVPVISYLQEVRVGFDPRFWQERMEDAR